LFHAVDTTLGASQNGYELCGSFASSQLQEEQDGRSTIMVRNLPKELEQDAFVHELVGRGYAGLFNFVYMPMNFRAGGNFGYAFVIFVNNTIAVQFMMSLEAFEHDEGWRSIWSTCQGLDEHIERYRNSPLMHDKVPKGCKPAMYDESGARVLFPLPTKPIPKPRIHFAPNQFKDTPEASNGDIAHNQSDSKLSCRPGRSKKSFQPQSSPSTWLSPSMPAAVDVNPMCHTLWNSGSNIPHVRPR
jgi:hypothetical protein